MRVVELLREQGDAQRLLLQYHERRAARRSVEWHDRIMELDECDAEDLSRLHGLLLAHGLIETRVHPDAFQAGGRLADCYRITPEGARAVTQLDAVFGLPEEVEVDPAETTVW